MAEESKVSDPYEAALADLYQRREQLNQAIALLESIRGGGSFTMPAGTGSFSVTAQTPPKGAIESGSLLGMSIVDATKKLLAEQRRPLKNPEIATFFKQGGLHLNSKDWTNTIGAVLTRRFQEVGDIVRVDRGTFGLKEWYPNRSFKKEAGKVEEKDESQAPESEPKAGFEPATALRRLGRPVRPTGS